MAAMGFVASSCIISSAITLIREEYLLPYPTPDSLKSLNNLMLFLREDPGNLVTSDQHPLQHGALLYVVTPGVLWDVHHQLTWEGLGGQS